VNHSAADHGFTLIEVLVALVIVAVGMAALMGALSSSANNVSYMRDKTFAEWVALNQIANLRLQLQPGQTPPVANTNGEIDFAGRSWHWRQEVVTTQVQGMMRVDVKVRPAEVKAGDDNGWFVTMSGLTGDAVGAAGAGTTGATWDSPAAGFNPNGQNPGTTLGGSGTTPGTTSPGTPSPNTPAPHTPTPNTPSPTTPNRSP
jgi:general secretion pathway protein I